MKDVKILAIFVGLIVDIGGSLVLGTILGLALVLIKAAQGMPMAQIAKSLDAAHQSHSLPILLCSLGLGGLCSFLGGIATGWMANVSFIKNASITGAVSIFFSLFFWNAYPVWYDIVGCLFTLPPAVLGGYLARLFAQRRMAPKA